MHVFTSVSEFLVHRSSRVTKATRKSRRGEGGGSGGRARVSSLHTASQHDQGRPLVRSHCTTQRPEQVSHTTIPKKKISDRGNYKCKSPERALSINCPLQEKVV